jgi:hypothetical protein
MKAGRAAEIREKFDQIDWQKVHLKIGHIRKTFRASYQNQTSPDRWEESLLVKGIRMSNLRMVSDFFEVA